MLSRDCDGCSHQKACNKRYVKVVKAEKVYCPDGTAHLVDEETENCNMGLQEQFVEIFQ